MPRQTLQPGYHVEHLSILDSECQLDEELDPKLGGERLKRLYHTMLLARRFDEFSLKLQRQGRIGTFAPSSGQEAAQLGAVAALRETDWVVPSFREMPAALWRGATMEQWLLYNAGFNEGADPGDNPRTLPISIPVGSQLPHAVGLAYAAQYYGRDDVALTFFGDGATSEGDFHEALNYAGVFKTPVIFLCQNNQWAISVPREHQSHAQTLAQKAIAYGIPGLQVDGNDVLAVYVASCEAVARARRGDGPTLIECFTYRMAPHTTADDPHRYRNTEEEEAWKKCDPLRRFRHYLEGKGLLDEESVLSLEAEIKDDLNHAWQGAEARMEALLDDPILFDHHYAEMPPYLARQRKAFINDREREKGERDG